MSSECYLLGHYYLARWRQLEIVPRDDRMCNDDDHLAIIYYYSAGSTPVHYGNLFFFASEAFVSIDLD